MAESKIDLVQDLIRYSCSINHMNEGGKCFSKSCVLNHNHQIAIDIEQKGCELFKKKSFIEFPKAGS